MYCKNCGAEIDPNAAICVKCGFSKGTGNKYCSNCGNEIQQGQVICTNCRVSLVSTPHQANSVSPQSGKGLSLASLITGIVGLLFFLFLTPVTILCGITGSVLGAISLGAHKEGKGMAIAGLACSLFSLLLIAIWTVIVFRR